jgi:hypothetical protein
MPCDWLGIERLDECEDPDDATEYSEYLELRFELEAVEAVEAFHIGSQRQTCGRHMSSKEHSPSIFGHSHQFWAI